MAAQGGLDSLTEAVGFVCHHTLGLFETIAHGIVAACPRVVERGLVGAEVNVHILIGEAFPEVHYVAYKGEGDNLFVYLCTADTGDEFGEVGVQFVHPALLIAFLCRLGVDFRRDADHSCYVARLGLRAGHTAETGCYEEHTLTLLCCAFQAALAELFAGGVHDGDGGAVDDALRTDVHIRACGHLSVLRHAEGVEPLPVIGLGVVGDDHTVGDDHAGRVLV